MTEMTKNWHLFGLEGMWGNWGTDPSLGAICRQAKKDLGVDIHASPYDDRSANALVAQIDKIPLSEGVFLLGTSLGACNVAMIANRTKRRIDGMFGFQASIYGLRGYPVNANVGFARLIYSYNPIPFPGLGAYCWPRGTIPKEHYVQTPHHLAHPGDYDTNDQKMVIADMRNIMKKG